MTRANQRTGAARRRASMRSRIPPWPGSMVPESLTPAPRLTADSRRSPSWAAMLRMAARRRVCQTGSVMWRRRLPRAVRRWPIQMTSPAARRLPAMEALGVDGEVGEGDDEGDGGAEGHPPEGDAELGSVRLRADGGELEVLVCCQLGDDGGEEGDHPELAKEDEGEDSNDENYGG